MNANVPSGAIPMARQEWAHGNEFTQALKRQQKLADLRWFSGQVAHELRNPLTAISLRLGGLERQFPPASSEREETRLLSQDVKRVGQILSSLMAFAEPFEPVLTRLRPHDFFREVRRISGPQLAGHCISVRTDVQSLQDVPFDADAIQMKQAILHLVQNAAEAVEHHGAVVLRARSVRGVLPEGPGQFLALEVEDDGPGIPAKIQPRIFDPFFTTKRGSVGLGLSIAAQIVDQHRPDIGSVTANRSRAGRGHV